MSVITRTIKLTLNVSPCLSMDYMVDCLKGYAKLCCQRMPRRIPGFVQLPDSAYVGFGQLGTAMRLTSSMCLRVYMRGTSLTSGRATFVDHIRRIFSRCSKPQMCRIHARWCVTAMQAQQVSVNRTIGEFVSHSVGGHGPTTTRSIVDPKTTVTVIGAMGHPNPAIAGSVNLAPKTILEWCRLTGHSGFLSRTWGAMLRAVSAAPGLSYASNYTVLEAK